MTNDRSIFDNELGFYKLFAVFFVGSFLGVIIELIWCAFTLHRIESRNGLVLGPFNLVYGFGALLLAVSMYFLQRKGLPYIFLGGIIMGSIVEYAASFIQEFLFNSRSWDYSRLPLNINGRICLLYSVFWGFLAILWCKILYPLFSKMLNSVPNSLGKSAIIVLLVFMIANTVLSFLALERWKMRIDGNTNSNTIWHYFDKNYPNDKMEKIFANMHFK